MSIMKPDAKVWTAESPQTGSQAQQASAAMKVALS